MEFQLIIKKLKNQLTAEEQLEFDKWYQESEEHRIFFKKASKNFRSEEPLIDQQGAWVNINAKLRSNRNSRFDWKYAIAAILILGLCSTIFLKSIQNTSISEPSPSAGNAIVLTTEEGNEIELTSGKIYKNRNVTGSGKQLHYEADFIPPSKISYNFLTIPRGEQFKVRLSDNTKIWLNSDTKIKYPVRFTNNDPRIVEVIYGEAFFEVSPSSENNGMNFFVKTRMQTVEVLGTEFNVKAYKEDKLIATTLAEGEISLSNETNTIKKNLKPGFQSIFNPEETKWFIKKVNIDNVISWKEGVLTFRNKELKEIMTTLSSWYDLEVEFADSSLKHVQFNGVFHRTQSLENILTILQETGKVQYEIVNHKINLSRNEK